MKLQSGHVLMSGNEAIARGALEAGIGFCASYPGTPSTEITSTLMRYSEQTGMYVEWSINEKVALEAAAAASWAGIPALAPMKSLGLNVAADFLLNLNLSGSGPGGLIIVVCDDPRGHSSSNEQDSRFFAKAASIPLLEPSTCQQAKDIVPFALALSQQEQIPVILRSNTRLSHTQSVVTIGKIPEKNWELQKTLPDGLYNVPDPHQKHRILHKKINRIATRFDKSGWNQWLQDEDESHLTVISTGIGTLYAEEALRNGRQPVIRHLSIVTTFPIPKKIVSKAIDTEVIVVEEGPDPFFEDELRIHANILNSQRIIYGRRNSIIPSFGELSTDIVLNALSKVDDSWMRNEDPYESFREDCRTALIPRTLTFCAGCTHRNVYWALQKVKRRLNGRLVVTGDIGCYSLGIFYNKSLDTMQAMGSGIGTANGLGQLHRFGYSAKVATIAGDSTFFHACIPGIINARHKNADILFIIVDNNTTAMTGFQPHPGTSSVQRYTGVSIDTVVKSIKPDIIETIDGTKIPELVNKLYRLVVSSGLKIAIVNSICRLDESHHKSSHSKLSKVYVDETACIGDKCNICVGQYSCVALSWDKAMNVASIIEDQCIRCGSCIDVCPQGAIKQEE